MSQMSRASQEALKNRIRNELANSMGYAQNQQNRRNAQGYAQRSGQWGTVAQHANMATLNPAEFHPDVMVAGSTGEYRDMQGGAHFERFDCGHTYNDSVIRDSFIKQNEITKGEEMLNFLHDKENIQKAVIVGDIIGTRGGMRRRKKRL